MSEMHCSVLPRPYKDQMIVTSTIKNNNNNNFINRSVDFKEKSFVIEMDYQGIKFSNLSKNQVLFNIDHCTCALSKGHFNSIF